MAGTKAVTGTFEFVDHAIKAIDGVKAKSWDYTVYSPALNHELIHHVTPKRSNVRYFTGIGAVSGLCAGFGLAIWTSLDYPLRVSAKTIVSIPGFVVIGYEWTILWGALATLLGLFYFCGIPNIVRKVGYHPRFSDDRFGVVVNCGEDQVDAAKNVLKSAGAEEVLVEEGL